MILHPPFIITARLMAGVKIGDDYISGKVTGRDMEGKNKYVFYINMKDGREFLIDDIASGCQGGSLQEGFCGLFSFLRAGGSAIDYELQTGRKSDNSDLFDPAILEWASEHDTELDYVESLINDSDNLITE